MGKLTSPGYVSRLLAGHGIRLKKKWGQNFLVDENIVDKIMAAADIDNSESVVEIGPGIGALTVQLAKRAGKVIAVEIDARLISVLKETLAEYANVEVIHSDAMDIDYEELSAGGTLKLVANLPYNVATPLLYRFLKQYRDIFSVLVCMVQKEVAERMVALPGGRDYGTLSVLCSYAAQTEMLFNVPGTVFFPRPDVASAVVRLRPDRPVLVPGSEDAFFSVVESVFSQRRKTILNTLHATFGLSKEELLNLGGIAGIDMARRGETLSVPEFAKLTHLIYNILSDR
ncbi:MAG: 16S rRNA (adenine(1518)-N(6)/adenine(1519)-N(6))-dimethyltransferase RsmA [Dethiobacter sp.]|nr:16S rRNA (adenine(1518)-N(6)/adenine(1519)-N(6))-dimethyltransferase RsmA [Dethiobacter sp.]